MSSEPNVSSITLVAALRFAAGTDIGLRREENQDAHGIIEGRSFRAFFVCDGMGGVQGGAIASNLAVASIREFLKDRPTVGITELASAVTQANANVFERGASEPGLAGMGTTCVGLVFTEDQLLITNVGDSRAYRIRGDEVEQLTEDHTLVQELVRSGAISAEQAGNHPVSHMLTRSLGPTPTVDVDYFVSPDPPQRGDRYLLCCDGLFNMVGAEEFGEILEVFSLDDAVQELIDLANLRGGTDNITLIIIEVGEAYPHGPEPRTEATPERAEPTPEGESEVAAVEPAPNGSGPCDDMVSERVGGEKQTPPLSSEPEEPRPLLESSPEGGTERVAEPHKKSPTTSEVNGAPSPNGEPASVAPVDEMKTGEITVRFWERLSRPTEWLGSLGSLLVVLIIGYGIGYVTSHYPGDTEGPMMSSLPKPTPAADPRPVARIEVPPVDQSREEAAAAPGAVADAGTGGDRERMQKRLVVLRKTVADLDAKIGSFNKPIGGEVGESLSSTRKSIDAIERELERIRADLDIATRRLAVWYGRRKRLQDADPVNLASEVAVAAPDVRRNKEEFEQATWAYLKEAEVLRYTLADKAQGEKVANLARERAEKMSILAQAVRTAIEREVGLADRQISELTVKRDEREEELAALRREVEYVKILTGADASARASKRAELQRERDIAAAELAGLAALFESSTETR
jgi:serine/threonine protein phosphatase PrpC